MTNNLECQNIHVSENQSIRDLIPELILDCTVKDLRDNLFSWLNTGVTVQYIAGFRFTWLDMKELYSILNTYKGD